MSNKNNALLGRGFARPSPNPCAGSRADGRWLRLGDAPARRAWRTHAYRDSQVIFYGHDLPSEFCGRRR